MLPVCVLAAICGLPSRLKDSKSGRFVNTLRQRIFQIDMGYQLIGSLVRLISRSLNWSKIGGVYVCDKAARSLTM